MLVISKYIQNRNIITRCVDIGKGAKFSVMICSSSHFAQYSCLLQYVPHEVTEFLTRNRSSSEDATVVFLKILLVGCYALTTGK